MRRLVLLVICALTAACNQAAPEPGPEPEKDPPIATIPGKQLLEATRFRDGKGGFLPLLQVNQPGTIKLACKGPDRTTRWIIDRRADVVSVVVDTGHAAPDRLHQWRQMQSFILSGDPKKEPHHPPALLAYELADGLITRYAFLSGSVQVISIPVYSGHREIGPREVEENYRDLEEKGVIVAKAPYPSETARLRDVFEVHALLNGFFEQPATLVQTWPCKAA